MLERVSLPNTRQPRCKPWWFLSRRKQICFTSSRTGSKRTHPAESSCSIYQRQWQKTTACMGYLTSSNNAKMVASQWPNTSQTWCSYQNAMCLCSVTNLLLTGTTPKTLDGRRIDTTYTRLLVLHKLSKPFSIWMKRLARLLHVFYTTVRPRL